MAERTATCSCGALRVTCDGEPVRISICHCPACQRRTGSVFGATARFPDDALRIEGRAATWVRAVEDEDGPDEVVHHFCPVCGSNVFWRMGSLPGFTSIAIGAFADPSFPAPTVSTWEETRHPWLPLPPGIEHVF